EADDLALGFDRVIAVGVKSSLREADAAAALAGLLDAHHYSRGLAFVPQGTPTNNIAGVRAGYPPPDPNAAASAAVELGPPLVPAGDTDADRPRFATPLRLRPPRRGRRPPRAGRRGRDEPGAVAVDARLLPRAHDGPGVLARRSHRRVGPLHRLGARARTAAGVPDRRGAVRPPARVVARS